MTGISNFCIQPKPLQATDLKPALIKLSDVSFKRGRRTILSDINLSIRRGDFVAITGPNGGGKTTLIRIILGLLKPTGGNVERLMQNLRISYLPQKSRVDSNYPISVSEVIASGMPARTDNPESRVGDMLRLVELTEHARKPIGVLSGGQLQRVLLARAIISKPEVLVLDEPLSYIDKHFEKRIYEIIGSIADHTTIIMVSHEITTAASMANRHLIVDRTVTECQSAHHFARIALCEP